MQCTKINFILKVLFQNIEICYNEKYKIIGKQNFRGKMKKLENKKVIYYKKYSDDIIESKNQNYKIKDDFKWIHNNIFYRVCSWLLWKIAAIIVFIYYKLILHVKVENKDILKKYKKQGYFMYGNHTQIVRRCFYAMACSW